MGWFAVSARAEITRTSWMMLEALEARMLLSADVPFQPFLEMDLSADSSAAPFYDVATGPSDLPAIPDQPVSVSTSTTIVADQGGVLTATVTSGNGVPTGLVTFCTGTAIVGQALVDSQGRAAVILSGRVSGSVTVWAEYSGTEGFLPSRSNAVSIWVSKPTTLFAGRRAERALANAPFVLTVNIGNCDASTSPRVPLQVGTPNAVIVREGKRVLAIIRVRRGAATLVIKSLAAGRHRINATYTGDALHLPSVGTLEVVAAGRRGTDYMPLRLGNRWFYDVNDAGALEVMITSVSRRMLFNGKATMLLSRYSRSSSGESYVAHVPGGSVVEHGFWSSHELMTQTNETPILSLPGRIKVGASFSNSGTLKVRYQGYHFKGFWSSQLTVAKAEAVKVPAGTFSTVRIDRTVTYTYILPDDEVSVRFHESSWFALGVGIVKLVTRELGSLDNGDRHSSLVAVLKAHGLAGQVDLPL